MRKEGYDYLKKITAVDKITEFDVVYVLSKLGQGVDEAHSQEVLVVKLPHDDPTVLSIMEIYPAADWYERELSEMFGIKIEGRSAIKKLLLEEWNGTEFPLRKGFVWGKEYKRWTDGKN
jgi:NADH:ubiquinone oxidoreductase subunit C